MSTSKSQRLVNLVICLLSREQFISAEQIRYTVQGYEDSSTQSSFERTFERDKAELEAAGVHLETGPTMDNEATPGYRIRRADVELPPLELTPRAAGVLAIVSEVWSGAARNAELTGALTKLRAGGIRPQLTAPVAAEPGDSRELELAADLAEYSTKNLVVTFCHTGAGEHDPLPRRLEPWLVGTHDAHWYVVGYDLDRDDVRCFRLSRIAELKPVKNQTATHSRPPVEEIQRILEESVRTFDPSIDARVWVADGSGAELRAHSHRSRESVLDGVEGDELELTSVSLVTIAELVAGACINARAIEPPELVDAVIGTLRAALEAVR